MRKPFDKLTAADAMRGGVVTIPATLSLLGAARVLTDAGVCSAPVTDDRGRCVGMLHTSDLHHWIRDGDMMNADPACFWSEWQMAAPVAGEIGRRMDAMSPAADRLREAARQVPARQLDGRSPTRGERLIGLRDLVRDTMSVTRV